MQHKKTMPNNTRLKIYHIYSRRQKKVYTSLNRRKIKSNKDTINYKTGNKAGSH